MAKHQIINPKGISLTEFKKIVADWPDSDYGVWIETGDGLSSPLTEIRCFGIQNFVDAQ